MRSELLKELQDIYNSIDKKGGISYSDYKDAFNRIKGYDYVEKKYVLYCLEGGRTSSGIGTADNIVNFFTLLTDDGHRDFMISILNTSIEIDTMK